MENRVFETDCKYHYKLKNMWFTLCIAMSIVLALMFMTGGTSQVIKPNQYALAFIILIFLFSLEVKTKAVVVYEDRIDIINKEMKVLSTLGLDDVKYIKHIKLSSPKLAIIIFKDKRFPNNFIFFRSSNIFFRLRDVHSLKEDPVVTYIKNKIKECNMKKGGWPE